MCLVRNLVTGKKGISGQEILRQDLHLDGLASFRLEHGMDLGIFAPAVVHNVLTGHEIRLGHVFVLFFFHKPSLLC